MLYINLILEIMKTKVFSKQLVAFLIAFTGVVLFSAKAVIVKIAYQYDVDTQSLLMLRFLFALPIYVWVLLVMSGFEKLRNFHKAEYLKIVALGILGYYLASYLDFTGLNYITASLERLILFVYPTIVLIISSVFLKKKATKAQKIAVVITYLGVILAFYQNNNVKSENLIRGSVLIFLSALSYAIYLVGSSSLISKFGTKIFTSIAMIVACIVAISHYLISGDIDFFGFPKEVYLLAFAMATASTVVPSFLISEAIRLMGASNVAVIGSYGPVSTIVLAVVFLGESITPYQITGTVIVIAGIMIIAISKDKSQEVYQLKRNT